MSEKYNLGIYLLKPSTSSMDDVLSDVSGFTRNEMIVDGCNAVLYIKQAHGGSPKWSNLFSSQGVNLHLENKSSSAVFVIRVDDRTYAIPFGYGWSAVAPDCIEENFGLKVILSLIEPQKIRSVDAFSLESIRINQRKQASKTTDISDFGLDYDRDLISSATGCPDNDEYGKCISGKDSIRITLSESLTELPALLRKLYLAYNSGRYKESFPWIDHVSEVRNQAIIDALDNQLINVIPPGNSNKTWLSIPNVIDWTGFQCFKYQHAKRGEEYNDIILSDYLSWLSGQGVALSLDVIKKNKVLCMYENRDEPEHSWSIYKCLYSEIDLNGALYVLADGKWYLVNQDYLSDIQTRVDSIPLSNIALPDCLHSETEKAYNARACTNVANYKLLDCDDVAYGGGHSKVEFCDILTLDKHIIHVKKYGNSSVLSHLFSQGVVSARLFKSEQKFRDKLNEKLPDEFKVSVPNGPSYQEYEVVFAIISNDVQERPSLPLFSKITLATAYSHITSFGYKVSIKAIRQSRQEQNS